MNARKDRINAETQNRIAGRLVRPSKEGMRLFRPGPIVLGVLSLCWIILWESGNISIASQNIVVRPGDNISALVEQQPSGTTFLIKSGIYRLQSVRPKDGDIFVGEPGAVLSGAQSLTQFSPAGQLWRATINVKKTDASRGKCNKTHPACQLPEDLFLNDSPLQRVESSAAVGPGKWFLDYSTNTAYLADNPQGLRVEISVTPHAFWGSSRNVKISGLTIEKYACSAGAGAVDGRSDSGQMGSSWTVENNVIRWNHGMGIRLGDGMQVLHNKLISNGQLGVGGGGNNDVVDGNEISFNNYAGYEYGWEAGGSKFAFTKNLVVRNNYAHDNKGPGLWTDLENENTLYEHNHTESNQEAGILHEVSYSAVIRDNTIENDGYSESGQTAPWYGAGIVVAGSSDVEVYGNTILNCMNGIVGTQ